MKTEKIEKPYTLVEGQKWKVKVAEHLEKGGKLIDPEGVPWDNPGLLGAPHRYQILHEPKKKWVPFTEVKEVIGKAIKSKASSYSYVIDGAHTEDGLLRVKYGNDSWSDAAAVLNHFTFLDGTPCGVEVELRASNSTKGIK